MSFEGIPISQLPNVNIPYNGNEQLVFVQNNTTKSGTLESLRDYISPDISNFISLTGNWENTYITVAAKEFLWDNAYDLVFGSEPKWNSNYSTVNTSSGSWDNSTSIVQNNSAAWIVDTIYDDSFLQSTSGSWDSTYTTVSSNSATWGTGGYDDSTLQAASGDWNAAYSVTQGITGLNNYVENTPNVHHTALIGGEGLSATGSGQDSFLGGGSSNRVESYASGIIGGDGNITSGDNSFLAGGNSNVCDGYGSTIIGSNGAIIGNVNNSAMISTAGGTISGGATESIIIGGENNVIHQTGYIAAIVGGDRCEINKPYGIASGRKAIVNHNNARVFADGNDTVFTSISADELAIQASGLRLDDGNQAAGRILTCDSSGTGTWQVIPAGGYDDSLLQSTSGNWNSTYTTVGTNSASWAGSSYGPVTETTIYVDAAAMIGESAGASSSTASDEGANNIVDWWNVAIGEKLFAKVSMPPQWDAGDLSVDIFWTLSGDAPVGESVRWSVAAQAASNDDPWDTTFTNKVSAVDDIVLANGDIHMISLSGISPGGTPADGDLLFFELERITATGTELPEDARLLGMRLHYQNTAVRNWYINKMGNETDNATIGERSAWVAPAPGYIHDIHSGTSLSAANAGLTVDIQKNGISVLATNGVIAAGTTSTLTSPSTAHVLTTTPTTFAQGDRISFVTEAFGGTGAQGLHTDLLISWD